MNSRSDLLKELFRLLEVRTVPYCVLRNYGEIFIEGGELDIDFLVEKRNLAAFQDCVYAAAGETRHRLVQRTRYINYSRVFWSVKNELVRVDFGTEIRWRFLPVLSAHEILNSRQKWGDFYVPHPRHEMVILFNQAIWAGKLTERYRRRLARMHEEYPDKAELPQIYRAAFGSVGPKVASLQAEIWEQKFDRAFCSQVRRSLIGKILTRPAAARRFAANVAADVRRLWQRLWRPAGLSLLYAYTAGPERNSEELFRQIEFLCPQKNGLWNFTDLVGDAGRLPPRRNLKRELRRLRAILKGGSFVESFRLAQAVDLAGLTAGRLRPMYASRDFIYAEDSQRQGRLRHTGTGYEAVAEGQGDRKPRASANR